SLQLPLTRTGDSGRFPNFEADFPRTGKCDQIDVLVIDQMRSDNGAVPREKIQNSRRDACFLEHLHKQGTADDRLLGRLHDHCVSGNNSGRRHAAENCDRKIPWRDYERHTARPVMMITFFPGNLLREFRAPESPHLLRVKPTKIDRLADVGVGFGPWLPDFENFYCREFVASALQDVGRALQQLRPLFKRGPPPFFESSPRSFNGALGFVDPSFRSVADNLARLRWINRRRQIIGPNFFASDVERMFLTEMLARFAQRALHFILTV